MRDDHFNERPPTDEPEGLDVVVQALRRLPDGPLIDDVTAVDPEAVAELLFDYGHRFDGTRLLYYMTALLMPKLDEVSRQICLRDYLLLNPMKMAEDAVVRLFCSFLDEARVRPFHQWARRVLEDVARWGRSDESLALFRPDAKGTPGSRLMAEIGNIANGLDPMTRRLVWMAWVDGKGIAEIAEGTGYPVERVEWLMDYVVQKATEAVTGHSQELRPDEPGSDRFWRSMGSPESDNG